MESNTIGSIFYREPIRLHLDDFGVLIGFSRQSDKGIGLVRVSRENGQPGSCIFFGSNIGGLGRRFRIEIQRQGLVTGTHH